MSVHTVIFDAGMTLLRAEPSFWDVLVAGIEQAGAELPADDARDAVSFGELWREHEAAWREAGESSPHIGDQDAETRYWRGLYLRFLDHLEVDGDHGRIAALVHDLFSSPGVFRPFPEVPAVLDELDRCGIRLGLLSNWGTSLRDILLAEELLDRFEIVTISGELGVAKPDPRIFEHILRGLGLEAGPAIAYVGDSMTDDVEPARELGLTAVLVDRWQRHLDHDGPRVSELGQLTSALGIAAAPRASR